MPGSEGFDREVETSVLYLRSADARDSLHRIGPTGQLVFGLGREVWIAVAGLEPPRTSPWSGTDAGPLGNPVAGWGQAPR